MKHVFIIGSKGIPASYGGFETFVDNLVKNQKDKNIQYHVACINAEKEDFSYHGAHCFSIKVPEVGSAKAIYYDVKAFQYCLDYIRQNKCESPIVCVLACRIGPFIGGLKKKLRKLGGTVFVNPDGHEWKRSKWNAAIKKYWKLSEKFMIKAADLVVCDSMHIEEYIREEHKKYKPSTTYIAYGVDVNTDKEPDKDVLDRYDRWNTQHNIAPFEYYLIVGRFVPENNYELIIKEFMNSDTKKDLVIITNVEQDKFYYKLQKKTGFEKDERIKFVGTVYEQELLNLIRANAVAYIHGHEVGGTNPSLLEALAATQVNLLYDVGFNREVAKEAAFYFDETKGGLIECMKRAERMTIEERTAWEEKAKKRIHDAFSQQYITSAYEQLFIQENRVESFIGRSDCKDKL